MYVLKKKEKKEKKEKKMRLPGFEKKKEKKKQTKKEGKQDLAFFLWTINCNEFCY
jgi:hypothetical protein